MKGRAFESLRGQPFQNTLAVMFWCLALSLPIAAVSWAPDLPLPAVAKCARPWVSYDYQTAMDVDTDSFQLQGTRSQVSVGGQAQLGDTQVGVSGFLVRRFGELFYRDGETVLGVLQDESVRGVQLSLHAALMRGALSLTERHTGDRSKLFPSYDMMVGPSGCQVGFFVETDGAFHTIQGDFSGDTTVYAADIERRGEGLMAAWDLWGLQFGYRTGTLFLGSGVSAGMGNAVIDASGQQYRFFAQTTGDYVWRFETERASVSGGGDLLNEDQQPQVRLKFGGLTNTRMSLRVMWALSQNAPCGVSTRHKSPHLRSVNSGFSGSKSLPDTFCDSAMWNGLSRVHDTSKSPDPSVSPQWFVMVEDMGVRAENLVLQTTPLWEDASAIGRKHLANDQTDYRVQQLVGGWISQDGFSGSLTLGRLAFLGRYREYETPLFFTYYMGSYSADIEELDYVALRLRYLWQMGPDIAFFAEGRQFLPFRIVTATGSQSSEYEAETPDETDPLSEDPRLATRWSGFSLALGVTWLF